MNEPANLEFATNPLPLMVRVKPLVSAVTLAGDKDVNTGTGFDPAGLMVKMRVFEVPPPGAGLNTVT